MKKTAVLTAILLMVAGASASAQSQDFSNDCLQYLSYYEEYYKQKAYDDATPHWRNAYKACPVQKRQTLLTNGATIVRRLISKNAKNPEYKQALIDTLLMLHNQRAMYFPKYTVAALNAKGQDVFNYIRNDNEKLLKEYDGIIKINKDKTKPTLFVHDFNAAVALYQAGKLATTDVIDIYQRNLDFLTKAAESDEVATAKAELEKKFVESKVASLDNLLAIFTPKYEADPDNLDQAKTIVKLLNSAEGGTDTDLFLNAVTTMHKLEPSYNSAFYLYRLNASKGNVNEAIAFLEEAIASEESDSKVDADYSYQLAAFCYKNSRTGKAFEAAKKAASLDESYAGKSYFLIANIWGATSCGGDEIARRSPYWVAVDYLQKAKAADESLTEEANRYIGMYSKYYPQVADAFMYGISDGQSYTVSCGGMTATTTVRTQK